MTQEQLKDRIQKTELKIEKIEKRIKKWQDAQTKEKFLKVDGWLLKFNSDYSEEELYKNYLKDCEKELDYAIQDLHDTQLTLEKYQNMLNFEINKDNEFENNRISVIWKFLLNWKEKVADYIRDNVQVLNDYYAKNTEYCNWYNNKYSLLQNMSEEEWKQKAKTLMNEEKTLKENIHPYTSLCAIRQSDGTRIINEQKLDEVLTKDAKSKYFELVDEVTEITGKILSATDLTITAGELNGIVEGEKGKAKVQTFSAGGWHIQCYHYRTRVTRV